MRRILLALLIVAGLAVLPAHADATPSLHWWQTCDSRVCISLAIEQCPHARQRSCRLAWGEPMTLHWKARWRPGHEHHVPPTLYAWSMGAYKGADMQWEGQRVATTGQVTLTPPYTCAYGIRALLKTGRNASPWFAWGIGVNVDPGASG